VNQTSSVAGSHHDLRPPLAPWIDVSVVKTHKFAGDFEFTTPLPASVVGSAETPLPVDFVGSIWMTLGLTVGDWRTPNYQSARTGANLFGEFR